jgi:hypothetical protein
VIVGSNPAEGMDVCLFLYAVLSCVGRGLCDGLITSPEESYRVQTRAVLNVGCSAIGKKSNETGRRL